MRTIQIGLEIHKAIEAARMSLDESEDAILMRVLKLAPASRASSIVAGEQAPAWQKFGVVLPEGTKLRLHYSGQTVVGEVRDGIWLVNGKSYRSPSIAMIENVVTKEGRRTTLNGWNNWEVRRPGDTHYVPIRVLRDQASRR